MANFYDWGRFSPFRSQEGLPVEAGLASSVAAQRPTAFRASWFKWFGIHLALMSAATLALGLADVITTYFNYNCNASPSPCSVTAEPYIWTWVGSGIWASIPIFIAGILSMAASANPTEWMRLFSLMCFLSASVFTPAMLVLTAVELWRGSASAMNFYMLNPITSGSVTAMSSASNSVSTKFGLPLAIAIIAGIMFLMTAHMTISLCCCIHRFGIYYSKRVTDVETVIAKPPPVTPVEYEYSPRPQIRNPYSLAYLPTRYNNVPNPYSSGVIYGNFPARPAAQPNSFMADFFKPNPSYMWQ